MLIETTLPDLPTAQRRHPRSRGGGGATPAPEDDASAPCPAAVPAAELRSMYLQGNPDGTLIDMPWAAAGLDADAYASADPSEACERAALVAAAMLDLKRRVENDQTMLEPGEDARAVDPAHTHRFYDAMLGSVVLADGGGRAALRMTEGAAHFIVSCGASFFEVPALAADGRHLTSAELLPMIRQARAEAAGGAPSTRIPLEKVSRFPRASLYALQQEMDAACLVNGRTLRALNRALFHLVLADASMQPPTEPTLGLDGASTTAQWLPSGLTALVYPQGGLLLRTNALLCSSSSLTACTAWVANAAATDPMISPPAPRPHVVKGVRKVPTPAAPPAPIPGSRARTPASPSKKGKGAPAGVAGADPRLPLKEGQGRAGARRRGAAAGGGGRGEPRTADGAKRAPPVRSVDARGVHASQRLPRCETSRSSTDSLRGFISHRRRERCPRRATGRGQPRFGEPGHPVG